MPNRRLSSCFCSCSVLPVRLSLSTTRTWMKAGPCGSRTRIPSRTANSPSRRARALPWNGADHPVVFSRSSFSTELSQSSVERWHVILDGSPRPRRTARGPVIYDSVPSTPSTRNDCASRLRRKTRGGMQPTGIDARGYAVELRGIITKSFERLSLHPQRRIRVPHVDTRREQARRTLPPWRSGRAIQFGAPKFTR